MKEEQVDYMFSRIRELPSEVSLEQVQAVVTGAAAGTLGATTSLSGKVFAKTLLNLKFMSLMGIVLTTTITLGLLFGGGDTEKTADGNTPGTGEESVAAAIEETVVDSPTAVAKKIPASDTLRLSKTTSGTTTVIVVNGNQPPGTKVTVTNGTAYVYTGNEDDYTISTTTDSGGRTIIHVRGTGEDTTASAAVNWSSLNGSGKTTCISPRTVGCSNTSSYAYSYSDNGNNRKTGRVGRTGLPAVILAPGIIMLFADGDSTVVTSIPSKNNLIPAVFTKELIKDKLIGEKEDYICFHLTGKTFKVDGKKQPEEIFRKYLKLYEDTTGEQVKDNFSYYYMYSDSSGETE